MKVVVTGGRTYDDHSRIFKVLHWLHQINPITELAHGCARGCDRIAGDWALDHNITVYLFPAEWDKYGRAAGAIRNQAMLASFWPDLVVAFPGGRGTANCVTEAAAKGLSVLVVKP